VTKPGSTTEHPRRWLALHTRTRLWGTFNAAVSLGGRSTGWGGHGRPRRTFIGHHRASIGGAAPFHRGIEFLLVDGPGLRRWTLFRVPLGSGPASLRRLPGLSNDPTAKTDAGAAS
jgi:hypothetical protein